MLSSIRFSCSLAAAEGPWEETTDEAEKKSLRILSFSRIDEGPSWTSWRQIVSRTPRIIFNIWALSSSLQVEI